jgi:hypothetical protein
MFRTSNDSGATFGDKINLSTLMNLTRVEIAEEEMLLLADGRLIKQVTYP